MKKRFLRLLAIACTATLLLGMMTGCRKETPSTNNTTENTEADSEIVSTQQETEETSSENTENTETADNLSEDTEQKETENTENTDQTDATESSDNTDISSIGNIQSDFDATLVAIQNIRAGSAGSSLRAEEAFSSFTAFVDTYGADNTSETICQMTTEWLDKQKEDNPYIYEEFAENFYSIPSLAEDSSLVGNDAYKHVVDGIQKALQ